MAEERLCDLEAPFGALTSEFGLFNEYRVVIADKKGCWVARWSRKCSFLGDFDVLVNLDYFCGLGTTLCFEDTFLSPNNTS